VSHAVLGCFSDHGLAVKVQHRDFSKLTQEEIKSLLRSANVKVENGSSEISKQPIVENLYITYYSKLKLIHPDNTEEPFDFEKFDLQKVLDINFQKLEERKKRLENLRCPICQTGVLDVEEYKKHMKERSHEEMMRQFSSGLNNTDND